MALLFEGHFLLDEIGNNYLQGGVPPPTLRPGQAGHFATNPSGLSPRNASLFPAQAHHGFVSSIRHFPHLITKSEFQNLYDVLDVLDV